jgi:HPr kinase/phosphorylase
VADQPLHASAVAFAGRGVLILGPSGSGKSTLALELMGLGAALVADDAVLISADPAGGLRMTAPERLRGLVEARGVGILRAQALDEATVALVVDLGRLETERLPPDRRTRLLEVEVPLLHKVESRCFPAAIRQYLACGRRA